MREGIRPSENMIGVTNLKILEKRCKTLHRKVADNKRMEWEKYEKD